MNQRRNRAAGASILAVTSLLSTYAAVVRPTAAMANGSAACADVTNQSSLDAALAAINASTCNTINVTASFTLTANGTPVVLNTGGTTAVTINGNGNTITGGRDRAVVGSGFRPFDFTLDADDSLQVNNITIDKASGGATFQTWFGGAIRVAGDYTAGGTVVGLDNVTITNSDSTNGASVRGGGGAFFAKAAAVTITDSSFSGNIADDGASLYVNAGDSITISDSSFEANTAEDYGGAAYLVMDRRGPVNLTNVTAKDNTSDSQGGAFYIDGTSDLTISSSTFEGNDSGDQGGAVWTEDGSSTVTDTVWRNNTAADEGGAFVPYDGLVTITNNLFEGNVAQGDGGAVYMHGFLDNSTVVNSVFTGNAAQGGSKGGAIYADQDGASDALTITDSSINSNVSTGDGGGLFVNGPLTLDGVEVHSNSTTGKGGGVRSFNGGLTILDSTISSNTASTEGAAIYSSARYGSVSVAMTSSTIVNNTTTTGDVIHAASGSVSITQSAVINNSATLAGAGSIVQAGDSITTRSSTFATNTAAQYVLHGGVGDVTVDFTTIYDNDHAGSASYAIYGDEVLLRGSVLMEGSYSVSPVLYSGSADADYSVMSSWPGGATATNSVTNATVSQLKLGPLLPPLTPGRPSFVPASDSILVTGAPSTDLGTGVTVDQLGVVRGPSGTARSFVIGSRQTGTGPTLVNATPPSTGTRGTTFGPYTFTGTGTGPLTYIVKSGSLPAGLTLNENTGVLSGRPTATGASTFTVAVLNPFGEDESASITITISAPNPGPAPRPVPQYIPRKLKAGQVLLTEGGVRQRVTVAPKPGDRGVRITGPDFAMTLDGLNPAGKPMNLGPDGVLVLARERDVLTTGRGFKPSSNVNLYVDPEVRSAARAGAKAIYVGTLRTDAQGTFRGTATLPDGISPGVHDLQAVGVTPEDSLRAMTLGVLVSDLPNAVRNLRVTGTSAAGSADLAWRLPTGARVTQPTSYLVHYKSTAGGPWIRTGTTPNRTTTVANLIPGCSYYFSVTSRNEVGSGPRATTGPTTIPLLRTPRGDLRCLPQ